MIKKYQAQIELLVIVLMSFVLAACSPTPQQRGAVVREPQITAETYISGDGMTMPARAWSFGAGPVKAVVVALHGFNDYSNAFNEVGNYLAEHHHITTYAYDQRGFGGAGKRGTWAGTETYVADLREFCRLLRQRHPNVPLYVLGESMGGAIALVAFSSEQPPDADGVILSAPAVWARSTMPWYQRAALFTGAHLFPWLTLTGEGIDITPSDNRDMLIALGRDPMVIKATKVGAMYGLTNLMDEALAGASAFDAPALILVGELDEIVPNHASAAMLSRLPRLNQLSKAEHGNHKSAEQKIVVYGNGYHMLTRDLQGQVVMSDIAEWIQQPTKDLPSGEDKINLTTWIQDNLH